MDLEEILEVFKYLSTPFDQNSPDAEQKTTNKSPEDLLQNVTNHCLSHVDFLESSKPLLSMTSENPDSEIKQTPSWNLTCIILSLLSKLKTAIELKEASQSEEENSINVLSIQSQITVQKSVELVVGFGVVPYLLPGIGVPEKLRKMSPNVHHFLLDAKSSSPYTQFLRLSHTIENLLITSSHSSLNALILPKYSSDIVAGLMQICKAPIARPKTDVSINTKGSLSLEQYENVMHIRENIQRLMHSSFLLNVPKSTLINSLFLISATEKPRWISSSCGDLLHEIILSKDGLIAVSSTLLESSGRADVWKLMRVISNLMKSALIKTGKLANSQTLSSLSEQCLYLVNQNYSEADANLVERNSSDTYNLKRQDNSNCRSSNFNLPYGVNVELLRIGFYCAITLMEVDFLIVKSAFWDRLFYHVIQLDFCQENQNNLDSSIGSIKFLEKSKSPQVSTSIEKTALCVTYVELLLGMLKPMNITLPLVSFQPVWSLFLQIFVACERYLGKPVQEPKVAAAVEQLHHKLRDVLVLLFEIYASGLGQSLSLPSINVKSGASASKTWHGKGNVDVCEFCMMLLLNQNAHQDHPFLNKFDFESCENALESVRIVRLFREEVSTASNYNKVFDDYLDFSCVSLCSSVLKNDKLKAHWPLIFQQLLSWGTKKHKKLDELDKKFKSDEMPTHLSGGSDDCITVNLSDCQRFITFKLLGELGDEEAILEQFGKSESVDETIGFLELLLNKFTVEALSDADDTFCSSQLIMYALGIIAALVEAASAATATISNQHTINQPISSAMIDEEINDMWDNLERFIPHLRKLTQSTQPSMVREGIPNMASDLLLTIGTRGTDGLKGKRSKKDIFKSRYQQAMEDAKSPLIHVKGHGILELRKLIEAKDNETLDNDTVVLKVFQENLVNEDSYLYLMSVQGLAALGLKFHRTVVPILIKEYDLVCCEGKHKDNENDNSDFPELHKKISPKLDPVEQIEFRMKVGEILVKVIQKLGELAPSYRGPLTNVFLRLMRDEEPLIRASALSNLGELCHLLKFSLGVILTEVWYCVESILSSEKNVHVRRAAFHLIVLLLRGVEKDVPVEHILTDNVISSHLRDVRRFLTQAEKIEADLVAKTHCQLALQELELIVKKLLTPNSQLTFKIQVLNL